MKTLEKYFFFLFVIVVLLGIFFYNTWSYRCGHCTASSLLSISAPALFLFSCNLLAGLALLLFRRRNNHHQKKHSCPCGTVLSEAWSYCPTCGQSIGQR